jgi:hypothetical protein
MAAASRAAFFCNPTVRTDLAAKLHRQCRARINRIRKTVGYECLPAEEVNISLETAISLGYFRALINRYSTDNDLDADWWREKRRLHAKTGKDRTNDFNIITTYFPEFESYDAPVTEREILNAAKQELHDLLASPGTEYHDTHMQVYKIARFEGDRRTASGLPMVDGGYVRMTDADGNDHIVEVIDPSAQDRVENSFVYSMLDDDRNIFGPGLSRVAALAKKHFGRGGIFWLAEWLFFPGEYAKLMRVIGLDEEALGQTRYEAVKRDLVRKLPQTHEDMMRLLRTDPLMLKLRDLLYGERFLHTLPPPTPPQVDTAVNAEREAYLSRWRGRMVEYVASDRVLKDAGDCIADDDHLLRMFIAGQDRADRLDLFRREVRKLQHANRN